jgi:multiple sugar transport system permease protein
VLRQAMFSVPNELIDAARVDGMSEPGIFVRIVIPLVSGALAALAILTALGTWNDYLWPLIVMKSADKFTLQVGISYAALTDAAEAINDWTVIMSSVTIASVPMLVLMIATQRYLVRGIALTGLKA